MSRVTKKYKKISTVGTGIHLFVIADLYYLKSDEKLVLNEGFPTMVVIYKKDGGDSHEQHYLIDKSYRQEQLKRTFDAAQVIPEEGKAATKKDAIGKRLWGAVKEIHHVMDDRAVRDENGPVIDYFIFKVWPYYDNMKKPTLAGDPAQNGLIPSGQFIDYKNHEKT